MDFKNNRNSRKRKFNHKNQHHFKKPKFQEKFEIVSKVKSQKGIRSQLVFMHGADNNDPFTILSNATGRTKATINVKNTGSGSEKDGHPFTLFINNEHIVEGSYAKENVARKELAKLAVEELQKSCFTIFKKIRPRDSPTVSVNTNAGTSKPTPKVGGIGAKMLQKMGWSGGGLGSQGQGITDIVKPTMQIDRQGFGTEHSLPVEEIKKLLQDYGASEDINSISFTSDFSKDERAIIHSVAQSLHLKSASYGKADDRRLVVSKKINPWQLINTLLEIGGENEQYQLISPSNFIKNDLK